MGDSFAQFQQCICFACDCLTIKFVLQHLPDNVSQYVSQKCPRVNDNLPWAKLHLYKKLSQIYVTFKNFKLDFTGVAIASCNMDKSRTHLTPETYYLHLLSLWMLLCIESHNVSLRILYVPIRQIERSKVVSQY